MRSIRRSGIGGIYSRRLAGAVNRPPLGFMDGWSYKGASAFAMWLIVDWILAVRGFIGIL